MRRPFIDNARAFGMVLVMFAHAIPESETMKLIYAFHMPLFFFISGALWKSKAVQDGWLVFLRKQVYSLMVPYLFFATISELWLIARNLLGGLSAERISPAAGAVSLFYGAGPQLRGVNGAMWFFTALFVTNVYFFWLVRIRSRIMLCCAALVVAAVAILIRSRNIGVLPWNLDVAGVALFFYALGFALLGRQEERVWKFGPKRVAIALGSAALCVVVALQNTARVDLRDLILGEPPLFFIGAMAGTWATMLLAYVVPLTRIAEMISQASIVIFPLHLILFGVFIVVQKRLVGSSTTAVDPWLQAVIFTMLALIICFPTYSLLKRFAPICIGGR